MDAVVSHPAGAGASGALRGVLARLQAADYAFVTPTPATHARVSRRRPATGDDALRDIFG